MTAVAHETIVPARLPDPCCGLRLYRSNPEDPGQLVCVTFHEGVQVAEVMDGEDAGLVLVLREMAGEFAPVR
jgi:hypothetical protein